MAKFVSKIYKSAFFKSLHDLWVREEFCDVSVTAGGKCYRAHKVVLSAGSPYFQAMFQSGMSEYTASQIHLQSLDSEVLQIMLQFFYTGEVEVDPSNCQELMSAANMFGIIDIVDACTGFLKDHLQSDNCAGIYLFAMTHSCTELEAVAESFIQNNFLQVCREEEFLQLPLDILMHFLQSEFLRIENEFQVFKAAMDWLCNDVASRRKHVFDIVNCVRVALISEKQLNTYLHKCSDFSLKIALQKYLQDFRIDRKIYIEQKMGKMKPYMVQPRKAACKNIYVVGGFVRQRGGRWSDAHVLSMVERLDTYHHQWHVIPSIHHPRSGHGVAVLNRQLLVIGGESDSLIYDSVECYDSSSNIWTAMPCLTSPRCGLAACTVNNCVYTFGGWIGSEIGDTVEKLDPQINAWTIVGKMPSGRYAMGVAEYQGLVYVVGGGNDLGLELGTVECYNPVTREWTALSSMSERRINLGVVALDGFIYAVGGSNKEDGALNSVERYNPDTDKWVSVTPMSTRRTGLCVVSVNGLLYAIGGRTDSDQFVAPVTLDSIECYNPDTDTWVDLGYMPTSRCEGGAAVL